MGECMINRINSKIAIDSALSNTSENPVQNKVINAALNSHVHGNITNTGDITTTVAIASGDRLVINDESESKLNNSSITFGTSNTQFLANNGTWQTRPAVYSGTGTPATSTGVNGDLYILYTN